MKVSILCIGDELLKGATINTNLSDIGRELLAIGIIPVQEVTVPDKPHEIKNALKFLQSNSDIIITSGGLGPTCDDISKEVIAEFYDRKLIKSSKSIESINLFWSSNNNPSPLPDRLLKQAYIPEGAEILNNEVGTAPGVWLQTNSNKYLAMLPGPPHELCCMLTNYLIPKIEMVNKKRQVTAKMFLTAISESAAEKRAKPILKRVGEVSIAYCASPEGVKIYLTSINSAALSKVNQELRVEFSENVLAAENSSLAEEVISLLKKEKLILSIAESCTGGMVASAITDLPGSSEVFHGSLVLYSNEWKNNLLKVRSNTLNKHGAVSKECVQEMVDNLCSMFSVDAAIAISGVAGPGGGSKEKPIGLVYIGVKAGNKSIITKHNFSGRRYMVRKRSLYTALNLLRKLLKSDI